MTTPLVLADVRCPKCDRLLARMEADALRPGKVIEWKCGKCDRHYTAMGADQSDPAEGGSSRSARP